MSAWGYQWSGLFYKGKPGAGSAPCKMYYTIKEKLFKLLKAVVPSIHIFVIFVKAFVYVKLQKKNKSLSYI